MTDPKKKPFDENQNQGAQTPETKVRTRADRINRRQSPTLSVTPDQVMGMKELVLSWFQELRPDGSGTAVQFSDAPPYVTILAARAGDPYAAPLVYRKTGRSAYCDAKLGFCPEDVPLLREGTVVFDVVKMKMPDGTPCLGVNLATARLAKTEKAEKAALLLNKRKRKGKNPPSLHHVTAQVRAALAAAAAAVQAETNALTQAQANIKAQTEQQAAQAIAQLQAAQALSAQAAQAATLAHLQAQAHAEAAAGSQAPSSQAPSSQAPSSQAPEGEEPTTQA